MLNRFIRYYPIIKILQKEKPKSILDVGSGSLGLGEFWIKPFTGLDIKFEKETVANMTPVKGSILNSAFEDSSFNCVIASDVLEHLPYNKRRKAIREILRLTDSMAIIGVPCGRKSLNIDKKLARRYKSKRMPLPNWLKDHLKYQYPILNQLVSILDKEGHPYEVINNENAKLHYWIMYLEDTTRYTRKIFDLIIRRQRWLAAIIVGFLNFGRPYRRIFVVTKK